MVEPIFDLIVSFLSSLILFVMDVRGAAFLTVVLTVFVFFQDRPKGLAKRYLFLRSFLSVTLSIFFVSSFFHIMFWSIEKFSFWGIFVGPVFIMLVAPILIFVNNKLFLENSLEENE